MRVIRCIKNWHFRGNKTFGSLITTQVTIGFNLIHDGDTDTMLSFVPSGDIIDLKLVLTRLRAENSGVDILVT